MEQPKYLDTAASFQERAEDLVSRMTLDEKVSQLTYNAAAVERLGVPAYNWWSEALHGIARAGTATMFPQAIGMAAMFDEEELRAVADIIATEARARYNGFTSEGDRDIYKGLTLWSPTVNIFRDPRWGRGQESYGEDPYLTSRLGIAFVKGLQGDHPKYLKTAACAKHFAVHSGPEATREEDNVEPTAKDLWETYLPAFEALVKEAGVESVMGAYNRLYGEPCCGSKSLIQGILRDKWGFDGHYVSDCWGILSFHKYHRVTGTPLESAALALKSGCDLNCGNTYVHLLAALEEGLVSEEDIDASVVRLMRTRLRLGMFDNVEEFDSIPYEKNDCPEHRAASLRVAKKSLVLLKNDGILPLNKATLKNVAIIGPNADCRAMLQGNYHGDASRYVTILEGIQDSLGGDARVYYAQGCHKAADRVQKHAMPGDRIAEAVLAAKRSDVAIVCLGLDETIEGETSHRSTELTCGDREDIGLPPPQQKLLEAIHATGTPVVLVLGAGSAMAVNWADEHVSAIVSAWYPGSQGGRAVASLLFGEYSPAARLPITYYRDAMDLPAFADYSMGGRTYRYLTAEPLYPFGFGLSYTSFSYSEPTLSAVNITAGQPLSLSVEVSNTGKMDGDEVVQLYIRDEEASVAVPHFSLCGFARVFLKAGEKKTVPFTVQPAAMEVVLEDGSRVIEPGAFTLFAGGSAPDARSEALTGKKPLSAAFRVE